ncbi:MAG: glycosyltransferase family 39 protein [Acidobacteriota bacterium]
MAAKAEAIITAALRPDLFPGSGVIPASRTLIITALTVLVLCGFGLRIVGLGSEGLSEDELNKLVAVNDYRQHGLTSANGEHPLLMKALQTATLVLADQWNSIPSLAGQKQISPEAALRLPSTIFGALTPILIYLLATELFGAEVGLIAAALWAFDPMAIGFNRLAKEDTFLTFFFLLANIFWLKGQRVAETQSTRQAEKFYWATAAAFGAMLASKYLPQLLAVPACYYFIFQAIPETRWRLGKRRLLIYYGLMGVVFVLLNPTILLPATWHQMGLFAGQKLVGHDGYEFMGQLYSHRLTDWLQGIPWYFYHVFLVVKLPVLTVAAFLVGFPLLFRRKLGDGRYFILIWMFLWMMTFSFGGGKFTRYFTSLLPAVLITAAIGVQATGRWLSERLATLLSGEGARVYIRSGLAALVIVMSLVATLNSAPHFRLYTNVLGGGKAAAGYYFPHDEFYDASMREAVFDIAGSAQPGARVASESPSLAAFYAERAKRSDLVCVSISDPDALSQLKEGDFIINARGRRYFSNDALISVLQKLRPTFAVSLGAVPSAEVYQLDAESMKILRENPAK